MSKSTSTELVTSTNLETVFFNRDEIPVTMVDGVAYVAIRPICEILGLNFGSQYNRIMRDEVLSSVVFIMKTTGADGKQYNMLFLPLDYFNGWLFGISVKSLKPELRPKMVLYKHKCYAALAGHFRLPHQGTIDQLNRELEDALDSKRCAARDCFQRRPHWRTIHDLYLRSYRFTEIAHRVRRSASACRHAVKRMIAMGLIRSRQVSMHKVLSRG